MLKSVLVLSYYDTANFGDRLGYHVLNSVLPPHAEATYSGLSQWKVPDRHYDLLILGIGNSLLPHDAVNHRLLGLLKTVQKSIGIFGTQYRSMFKSGPAADGLSKILDRLDTWWARYEDDLEIFGSGRSNARHLGDWLITAFPMSVPSNDKGLTVPAEFIRENVSLDRAIQRIQAYPAVMSSRLHPLLCALTSAKEVGYYEQRAIPNSNEPSGKFASMLHDVFGRSFDEGELFQVDRTAVLRYKQQVTRNVGDLRQQLMEMLG